ncbi:tetratricopeptide repeat protein 19 homolog, mitochondrial [Halyomorpha halys]|uniref:tetratricopeptide repeat protein 19 homolog, mitochondrial n=1 Tax=Halyomorpha halys TaxID=286706 RepID=UPI0006D50F31|nr:tetratricopeptide repeat protein 19 homolog, mitochondrial [Halyomorpha halys]
MKKLLTTFKRALDLTIKIKNPWQPTINQNKNIICLKHVGSEKIFFNKFMYFTFIGLGTKNSEKKKKEDELDKVANQWKREKDVSQHIALAEVALKHGEPKKAEIILQNVVQLCGTEPTVGVCCAYDMLATIAYKEGNILKAKDVLEKVIKYLISSGTEPKHDSVVQFRLKLARILSQLGFSRDAEENFKECLEIQKFKCQSETRNEDSEILWINSLFWYGKHLSNNKKYLEAKECFDSAYKISTRTKTLLSSQVMVILFNLSEMSFLGGQKDEALRYLLSAVTLGQLTNNADLATYYNRIGLIYLSKGLLKEAKIWCESGKDKGKRSRNKNAQAEGDSCIQKINEVIRLYKA